MSSESDSDGVALGGVWPSSLTVAETEDLAWFGLPVPLSAKLSRPWRISADGHPTLGPPTSREELRRHPDGRYDGRGRRRFWTSKNFDDVVGAFWRVARGLPVGDIPWEAGPSRRRAPATPGPSRRCATASIALGPSRRRASAPATATPPALSEVPLPSEQAALHQDGGPDDTPGLLAALAQSVEEAKDKPPSDGKQMKEGQGRARRGGEQNTLHIDEHFLHQGGEEEK
ncbi:hypothetical protein D1007_57016 [Hordeum vulgare]|nr:hypothetical protein D1007_57016 [Hordeum vulgare]